MAAGAAAAQISCARAPSPGTPSPRRVSPDGFYYPESEDDIVELIRYARAHDLNVRVRGSAHSVPRAIYTGPAGTEGINLILGRLRRLTFDDDRRQVTVQAGCNLGMDPKDPARASTFENGLFWQLNQRGWAVPDMGGIIHQTVGGFLSTGSAGGSLQHSIYDSVVAVRLIDGTGRVHVLRRPPGDAADDPFFAAVISMGLLGVVTEVTFQCLPKYHVRGNEVVSGVDSAPFRPFDAGQAGLEAYLRRTEHARILWWPQRGVGKCVTWQAGRMQADDYNDDTGRADAFRPKPYHLLQPILGSRTFAQHLASTVFDVFAPLNPPAAANAVERVVEDTLAPVFPTVVNGFLETDEDTPGQGRRFWDEWWKALPMDNEADDDLVPTQFTELWIPASRTRDVMVALRDHYGAGGYGATGTYACEIYAAKASPFWMSPAFGQDVLRIDLFWYARNQGDPAQVYYPQFWQLLDRFEPRYHWGKHLPTQPAALRARYPKWDAFLTLREQLDPDGVFLTPYWKEKLGLA